MGVDDWGEILWFTHKEQSLMVFCVLFSGYSLFGTMTQTPGTFLQSLYLLI
jgi:hypothetical protein